MKNWFVENYEQVAKWIAVVLCCITLIGIVTVGVRDLANTHIEWEFEENVELTDEMMETYCNLVRIGMEEAISPPPPFFSRNLHLPL